MDIGDEESIKDIIYHTDNLLQYDEHVGPKDKYYKDAFDDDGDDK
eukprot:CAMPEP_0114594176 /NCGR_PEP_ID=MMETSP0125-20121206/15798_1 /TAXON_ID=485358 ORGANISM="Aristerostoma sp., Strain ATCC 50986" /NCGR_SAMPLE_ID=MMETSP0125 /ASSEMBLY_ACC=CAM_ASM_000245 /LENGTH=44 /DNA_ID= /DNA_START= /DNA_END= /DNA_ORIENTATION=